MNKQIQLLDCTLRDGSYINASYFGEASIKGIINHLQRAKVDIIECGWFKDNRYEEGSAYYHVPSDALPYFEEKNSDITYVAMIDYNRYDVSALPINNGKTIDAIRIVFPKGECHEAALLAEKIRDKGYRLYMQAANTLGYSDRDLLDLIDVVNRVKPDGLSIVDTFGAMYPEDLERITSILINNLDDNIRIGFHSHNNMQLSFALSMQFVRKMSEANRMCIVDSSLCGMGRGAGNTTTELLSSFLNRSYHGNYDLDAIMDAIDIYMVPIQEKYRWGYSTPVFIAGLYCSHVNNIDYLLENHRTNARDMRAVIESLEPSDRLKYDYDLLETKYIENQNRLVDDEKIIEKLREIVSSREILLIAPGKSVSTEKEKVIRYAKDNNALCIAVNALLPYYEYDYLFLQSRVRYDYAKTMHKGQFENIKKILLSNVKTEPDKNEYIVRYERAIKRGYDHFDNAVICILRLLDKVGAKTVAIAGFDKMADKYNESYADPQLPILHGDQDWNAINEDIKKIYNDFRKMTKETMRIRFITESYFSTDIDEIYTD